MQPPVVTFLSLIIAGQTARFQTLKTFDLFKLRYTINIDTSYPVQSYALVEVWTEAGWKELWHLDCAVYEKCGGRPDHREVTTQVANDMLEELASYAEMILT